jgi:predicted DCC family thiol-disulfide oxidoreductase YuxK
VIAAVSDLPQDLQTALGGRDIIVFDGECVLCSGFFRFVLRQDRESRFSFVIAQSALGGRLYEALGLDARDFETNLVIVTGRIHGKLGALGAAMGALGWPWRGLAVVSVLPRWLADPLYDRIARNRYRLFGRYDDCLVPDAALRARFVDGGWARAA